MLILHQPPPAWGLPNVSPFCLKLETYLRMTGLPYEVRPPAIRLGPKHKVPYIRDGDHVMGDSGLIIEYLVARHGDPLDAGLDAGQRATAHAVRRMVEEHTYFAVAFLRWQNPVAWPHLKEAFRPLMPPVIGGAVMRHIRSSMARKAWEQGVGRHDRGEVLALLAADLDALDAMLGDRDFFFGEAPTSIDATLYGFLAQVLLAPWGSDEKELLRARPRLCAHVERMKARYWSDWPPA
jgi:glutathione S-transferase